MLVGGNNVPSEANSETKHTCLPVYMPLACRQGRTVIANLRKTIVKRLLFPILLLLLISCQSNLTGSADSSNNKIVIGENISLFSKILNEHRNVYISLPLNYDRNTHNYPTIIVFDAEYLFEITNSIVKIKSSRNEMPESIVIGIPNNTGKRYDMSLELFKNDGKKFFGDNGGKSKEYIHFISEELFPFLEENYRINTHKTIIGMSPTFGPVLESFWNRPELFRGHIVLAAELSLKTKSGETIAKKLENSIQDSLRPFSSIYIGKASEDLKRRPPQEAEAFLKLNHKLDSIANPKVNYTIEILQNENHYGMSISGIEHGLETIYPTEVWSIPYREFWSSKYPANEIEIFYENLSNKYGFRIIPLEDSYYFGQTLLGTVRRLERQGRTRELNEVIQLALKYYPNSPELNNY